MAIRYVWSGGNGSAPTTGFATGYATIEAARAASVAGDDIYIASDHNEIIGVASTTLTFPGTPALRNRLLSVNRTSGLMEQGALLRTTGVSNISIAGHLLSDGVNYAPGDGTNSATFNTATGVGNAQTYRNTLISLTNAVGSRLGINGLTIWEKSVQVAGLQGNCNIRSNANAVFIWKNSGKPWISTIPTYILDSASVGTHHLIGLDLSDHGVGKFVRQTLANPPGRIQLIQCKLNASMGMFSAVPLSPLEEIDIINCSNADGKNRREPHRYAGSMTLERGIYRTGGATDGVDNLSYKLAATANVSRDFPVDSLPIAVATPPSAVGVPKTVTVEIVNDGPALNNDQAWLEVQQSMTAFASDGPANALVAGVAQDASAAAWTTTGMSAPLTQKLAVTFTPTIAAHYVAIVRLAKPSATLYADPQPA